MSVSMIPDYVPKLHDASRNSRSSCVVTKSPGHAPRDQVVRAIFRNQITRNNIQLAEHIDTFLKDEFEAEE